MNNYITDVLSPQEEDTASNCGLMSSLAEHSYCASIMSTNAVTQDPPIGDLFENVSVLCNEMDGPIGVGSDVNLDGFNFSVPSVTASGACEVVDLENMWGGLNSDTATTIVEVAATNMTEEDRQINESEMSKLETKSNARNEGVKDKEGPSRKRGLKSMPRRTDFIADKEKRRSHFNMYFRKLASDLHRAVSRTGCDGNLTASFEGKSYDGAVFMPGSTSRGHIKDAIDTGRETSFSQATSANETTSNVGIDDHRYAATMLTQNVSSSAIRDHQYDEKTIAFAPESDTTDDDSTQENEEYKRKNSKRYRYEYIKIRWQRTQTFAKLMKSLFSNKIILQKRTGAVIQLSVKFEGSVFGEENFKDASSIVAVRRKQLQSAKFAITPKPMSMLPIKLPSSENVGSTAAPLTFFLPNFSPFPFQVPCVIPSSSSESLITQIGNYPLVSASATVSSLTPVISESVADTTFNIGEISDCSQSQTDNGANIVANVVEELPIEKVPVTEGIIMEESHITTENSSDLFIPVNDDAQFMGEQLQTFENVSLQNSPEITKACGMKETATNTEPICSICLKTEQVSNRYLQEVRGDHSIAKPFWIRCNDPFCYDMVHASCVGFVVTHSIHLRQLPAFYCKAHRC